METWNFPKGPLRHSEPTTDAIVRHEFCPMWSPGAIIRDLREKKLLIFPSSILLVDEQIRLLIKAYYTILTYNRWKTKRRSCFDTEVRDSQHVLKRPV